MATEFTGLLRPSIRLNLGTPSSESVTRLGGTPNMPTNVPWPARRDGQPHSFLAEIDLAQLPPLDGLPLPNDGSLFFFCDSVYIPSGSDPGDNDGFKVIYSPSPLCDNALRTPPRELDGEYIFKGFSLEPRLDLTAPSQNAREIERLRLSESELDAYGQLFAVEGSAHRIGGYPDAVQNDDFGLTAELVSHGVNCGSSRAYREGKSRGLGAGADDWRLLLQLDSEDDAGMIWGDAGRLYFVAREQDLKAFSFDRVWMGMQCG
ncbi:MAG: YwqG family protein [Terracidiphilus sp.]